MYLVVVDQDCFEFAAQAGIFAFQTKEEAEAARLDLLMERARRDGVPEDQMDEQELSDVYNMYAEVRETGWAE